MKLRQYQQEAIDAILLTTEHGVIKLPTGSGKTVIFTELIHQNENKNFLILTDRRILIEQTLKYLKTDNFKLFTRQKLGLKPIETLKEILAQFDYLLIDEAHGVNSQQGTYKTIFDNIDPKSLVIGFTATPYRLDNGKIYGLDKLFKRIIYEMSYYDLKDMDYLVELKYFTSKRLGNYFKKIRQTKGLDSKFEKETIKGVHISAIKELIVKYDVQKAVIYCISIKHAILIKDLLKENCELYHSKMSEKELDSAMNWFRNTEKGYLLNINMLTTGFDYPALENIIVARPTQSRSLWNQMLGRLTRISEGKTHGTVYDMVGNGISHGAIDFRKNEVVYEKKVILDEDEQIIKKEEEEKEKTIRKELIDGLDEDTESDLLDGQIVTLNAKLIFADFYLSKAGRNNLKLQFYVDNIRSKKIYLWLGEKNNKYTKKHLVQFLGENCKYIQQEFIDLNELKDDIYKNAMDNLYKIEIETLTQTLLKVNLVLEKITGTKEQIKIKIEQLKEEIEQLGFACREGQDYSACEEMDDKRNSLNKLEKIYCNIAINIL